MAEKPTDAAPAKKEEAKSAAESEAGGEAAAPAKQPGALKAWLPLILTVALMPVLAFLTTHYLLVPKMVRARSRPAEAGAPAEPSEAPAKSGEKASAAVQNGKTKIVVPLSKMLVNVAGTMGTRYLMTSVTLVGTAPDFKARIEDNKDQLMDLATGTLSSKTISDLEKPGARNVIRSELTTVLNNALGGPVIQEIYITELAIQ